MSDSVKCLVDRGSSGYSNLGPAQKRSVAVAAALELILTRVAASGSGGTIEKELESLSSYADTIQAALSVE